MIKTGKDATDEEVAEAKKKIEEVKELLDKGENFEDLAKKYSQDRGSANKGGALPRFGTGRMVPAFEKAAFGLENDGDYSEPFLTEYGWHIVKRLERYPVPSFEESEKMLSSKVAKDSRSQMSQTVVLNRIKKEYGFKENRKALDEIAPLLDSTLIEGKWDASEAKKLDKMLFSIGKKKYTQKDFAEYIESHQTRRRKEDLLVVMNGMYNRFVEESLLAFEESKLPEKYPEYKALLREYRDGILLFDLTDEKVWSKAVKDTAGLQAYYDKHKEDFMWDKRLDAELYIIQNDSILPSLEKSLKKKAKKGEPSSDDLLKEFNANSSLNLRVESDKYEKNDEEILEKVEWKKGVQGPFEDGKNKVFVLINDVLEPTPKSLKEARGLVTAAYQTFLEEEWIAELRDKYEFSANRELLKQIK
jgi:peptidyl-prolyl cis-trans isomerase SurA